MAVSAYSPATHDGAMSEMNITPLVDVMLVLLVIFMLAVPAVNRVLPMTLPQAPPNVETVPPPTVVLKVQAGGDFVLDGETLPAASLQAALDGVAARSPGALLKIDAAPDSEYQGFASALSAAQHSGLTNVTLNN